MPCGGQEIGNSLVNGIVHIAGTAMKAAFENLFLIFPIYAEGQIPFAHRAAKDVHK